MLTADKSTFKTQLKHTNVKDLINDKLALNDIINYEVQGGAKQLLKKVVAELDRAIISHGKENPGFAKNYIGANKKFSEHAKTFRNKNVDQILRSQNPEQLMHRMNSISGIRSIDKILNKSQEGKELFENLKRQKLDNVIGNNLVDSTTKQLKLGTFSKLLEKGSNRDVIKEILDPQAFKRLERLQKNAGRLADSIQKFYNASKSASTAVDSAIIVKGMSDFASILSGNPWPLIKTGSGVLFSRKMTNLLADSEFLKLVEDAVLTSQKGTDKQIIDAFEKLRPYFVESIDKFNEH